VTTALQPGDRVAYSAFVPEPFLKGKRGTVVKCAHGWITVLWDHKARTPVRASDLRKLE